MVPMAASNSRAVNASRASVSRAARSNVVILIAALPISWSQPAAHTARGPAKWVILYSKHRLGASGVHPSRVQPCAWMRYGLPCLSGQHALGNSLSPRNLPRDFLKVAFHTCRPEGRAYPTGAGPPFRAAEWGGLERHTER